METEVQGPWLFYGSVLFCPAASSEDAVVRGLLRPAGLLTSLSCSCSSPGLVFQLTCPAILGLLTSPVPCRRRVPLRGGRGFQNRRCVLLGLSEPSARPVWSCCLPSPQQDAVVAWMSLLP